ncbi:hypothetical protein KGY73_04595 [bacterium]|nr:hypothetical protein [bacterium]
MKNPYWRLSGHGFLNEMKGERNRKSKKNESSGSDQPWSDPMLRGSELITPEQFSFVEGGEAAMGN